MNALALGLAGCGDAPRPAMLWVREDEAGPAAWYRGEDGVERRLVPGVAFPADPDPRGRLALLVRTADGADGHREQLVAVDLASGAATDLTPPAGAVRNPAWSPDGAFVVFESDAASFRDLYRVERDGQRLVRLTDARHGSFEPAVSPDGRWVAYGTSRDGNAEIGRMNADGSDQRRLTDHPSDDTHPRWLPDGRIAWIASRGGRPRVWTMGSDGAAPAPLRPADDGAIDVDFAVSGDGRIAVVVARGSELGIEIVGDEAARVDGRGPDEHPAWSDDGRWLLFTSSRGGNPDVWRVDRDGGAAEPLTDTDAADWLPRALAGPR